MLLKHYVLGEPIDRHVIIFRYAVKNFPRVFLQFACVSINSYYRLDGCEDSLTNARALSSKCALAPQWANYGGECRGAGALRMLSQ